MISPTMSTQTARRIIGNQPITCVQNMALALSLCTYRNTPDEWTRLEAAVVYLKSNHARVPKAAKLALQNRKG
jgi:hypothetical protein